MRPRLTDILDDIAIVSAAVAGRDLATFAADPILRLAVERAMKLYPKLFAIFLRASAPNIPMCRGATSWPSATGCVMSITESTLT